MIVAWSAEEAGRYLEIYKVFEQKPPDVIRGKAKQDYMSVMQSVLTNVRGINKTDVWSLTSNFSSFAELAMQPPEKFLMLPGMGDVKAKNLARAFREPFQAEKVISQNRPNATEEHLRKELCANPSHENDAVDSVHETAVTAGTIMDSLPSNFDTLDEDEQLRIALQLSMDGQV